MSTWRLLIQFTSSVKVPAFSWRLPYILVHILMMLTNYLSWRFDCTNLLMKASLHSRTHTQDVDKLSKLAFWLYQPSHEGLLTFSYTFSRWWQTISAGVLTVPTFSWRLPYILVHILKMMTNYLSWRFDCTNLLMKASLHSRTHSQDDDKLSQLAFWLYQPSHEGLLTFSYTYSWCWHTISAGVLTVPTFSWRLPYILVHILMMMTHYLSWRFDCTNLLMKASLHSRTHTHDDDKLSQLAFWLYQPSHEGFLTFSYTYSRWWQTISAGVLTVPTFSWRLPYILVHILKMMTNYLSWRFDCTNLLMKASLHSRTHTQDDDKLSQLAFWLYQPSHEGFLTFSYTYSRWWQTISAGVLTVPTFSWRLPYILVHILMMMTNYLSWRFDCTNLLMKASLHSRTHTQDDDKLSKLAFWLYQPSHEGFLTFSYTYSRWWQTISAGVLTVPTFSWRLPYILVHILKMMTNYLSWRFDCSNLLMKASLHSRTHTHDVDTLSQLAFWLYQPSHELFLTFSYTYSWWWHTISAGVLTVPTFSWRLPYILVHILKMMTNYLSWRFDCTNLLMKASLHSRTHTHDDDKLSKLAFWLYQPSHEGFLTFSYTYSRWWQTISAGVLTVPTFSWRLPYILVHILKMMTNYLSWRFDCTNLLMKASLHSRTHTQDDDKLSKLAFWLYQPSHEGFLTFS